MTDNAVRGKPFKCTQVNGGVECGETDPERFKAGYKSQCRDCFNIKQNRKVVSPSRDVSPARQKLLSAGFVEVKEPVVMQAEYESNDDVMLHIKQMEDVIKEQEERMALLDRLKKLRVIRDSNDERIKRLEVELGVKK